MSGKVAVVTGGIGGIGTEICRELAKAGYRVVACDTPLAAEHFAAWTQERKDEGMDIPVYGVDVASFDSCRDALQKITAEVGPVDVLVNGAGITKDGTLKKMTLDQWRAVLSTNLDSVFNMTRNVIDGMLERGYGRVINIASVNGAKGQLGQCNYSSAKAGMHGFTMALAQEVARKNITVNTISPGYIGTKMVMAIPEDVRNKIIAQIPVGRLGKPEEIARLVVFLSDENTGFMTGANVHINGGQFMEH
ncbi:MAG: acetoacetyl-CoA reductase [Magnetococcales bacterium]|nr:acetoacetyl-CoA reductase [Magnetococcales bacterium]NGZ26066.1 acetoacetyl-CoA reductase [Magnetococcales bacterium]